MSNIYGSYMNGKSKKVFCAELWKLPGKRKKKVEDLFNVGVLWVTQWFLLVCVSIYIEPTLNTKTIEIEIEKLLIFFIIRKRHFVLMVFGFRSVPNNCYFKSMLYCFTAMTSADIMGFIVPGIRTHFLSNRCSQNARKFLGLKASLTNLIFNFCYCHSPFLPPRDIHPESI